MKTLDEKIKNYLSEKKEELDFVRDTNDIIKNSLKDCILFAEFKMTKDKDIFEYIDVYDEVIGLSIPSKNWGDIEFLPDDFDQFARDISKRLKTKVVFMEMQLDKEWLQLRFRKY